MLADTDDPAPSGEARRNARPEQAVDDRLFLQSVARALDVLEAFAASPRPMSLGELALAAGTNKSAAQRIAQTLLSRGYIERSRDGGLVPGRRILDRSFDYLRANPMIERAMPILTELRKVTNERVDLSLLDDLSTIYAVRLQSKRETFYATLAGRRVPTFVSSGGRACMAHLPDARVNDILARSDRRALTPKTLLDPARIWRKVREARRDGYAFATEEALIGEVVLAAAVMDGPGRPVGAVHIAGSLSEWSVEEFRKRFAPLAIEGSRALSG